MQDFEKRRPVAVSVALILMVALGLIWLGLGSLIALGIHPAVHIPPPWHFVMAALCIAAGLIAMTLVAALHRRSRIGFYGALAFLAASAVAVVFDQVGWTDLMFVAANVMPIILLLNARLWYLRP